MKRQLIVATALTMLLAGTSLVSAQRAQEGPSPAPSAAPGAAQPSPGGASDRMSPPPAGRAATDKAAPKAAQGSPAERSGTQPSGRMNNAADDKAAPRQQGTQAQQNREPAPANRSNQAQSPSSSGTQAQSPSQSGDRTQAGDRASSQTNVNVNLSADQRTRIRQTVLRESSAPRISRSDVNFNLTVGTVIPRTVHVAVLPAAVVEIHPAWRGYSYILVGDEIVILEPGSLRIIAIISA